MALDLDLDAILSIGVLAFSGFNTYIAMRSSRDLTALKLYVFENFVHRRDLAAARVPPDDLADALQDIFHMRKKRL